MQRAVGLTLIELLLGALLAGLLIAGAIRLAVAVSDQQQALVQSSGLQSELRRASGVAKQVLSEQPFLVPISGSPTRLEYLQALLEARFRVLAVRPEGLEVRFLDASYDPRSLKWAVVVDPGGNGYIYSLNRVLLLDAVSKRYFLEGAACTSPSGSGLYGLGASVAQIYRGAGGVFFQAGENPPELLSSQQAHLRYYYRTEDGRVLYQETPALHVQNGADRYELAGIRLDFSGTSGQGLREARRELVSELPLQRALEELKSLECTQLDTPPLQAGEWQIQLLGLDPNVSGLVEITGPQNYRKILIASDTLRGLVQGEYRLNAREVAHPTLPFVRYRPSPTTLAMEVGGANRPVTRVRYRRLPGRLQIKVAGLGGPNGSLHAVGSFAEYRLPFANGTRTIDVEAGRYTLEWPIIPDPSGRGEWKPNLSHQTVDVPSEGVGVAPQVRYRFVAFPYEIEVNVNLEQGSSGKDPIVCIRPGGANNIKPGTPLQNCQ